MGNLVGMLACGIMPSSMPSGFCSTAIHEIVPSVRPCLPKNARLSAFRSSIQWPMYPRR